MPEMSDKNLIKVWPFHHAPRELRELSTNGGDEDWLALVPPGFKDAWIPWLEMGPFGCCHVNQYELPNGSVVHIGCHA